MQDWEQRVGELPIACQKIIRIAPSWEHRSAVGPFWQAFWRLIGVLDRCLLARLVLSWTLRCAATGGWEYVLHESNGR